MKKFPILILGLCLLPLNACGVKTDGGQIVFEATSLGKIPLKEEKTFIIKQHEFICFNVCSDDDGNFILANHDSYIINKDLQFGIRFKHVLNVAIYDISDEDNYVALSPISKDYENGDWGYQVNFGFMIRQDINLSMDYCSNIGKITHWC